MANLQEPPLRQHSLSNFLHQASPPHTLVDPLFPVTFASVPVLWASSPRRPVQTLPTPCLLTCMLCEASVLMVVGGQLTLLKPESHLVKIACSTPSGDLTLCHNRQREPLHAAGLNKNLIRTMTYACNTHRRHPLNYQLLRNMVYHTAGHYRTSSS